MRRRLVVAIAISTSLAACNGLLGIRDLVGASDAGQTDDASTDATLASPDGGADSGVATRDADASAPAADAHDGAPTADAHDGATTVDADASVPTDGGDAEAAGPCVPTGSGLCRLDPQCGCGPGQTCDLILSQTQTVGCLEAGTIPAGEACPTFGGCAVGLTCYVGVCKSFCSDPAGCATSQVCAADIYGQPFAVSTCHDRCDLLDASACSRDGGRACSYDWGADATDCWLASASTTDCPDGLCAPGYVCLYGWEADGGSVCAPWCRSGGANTCPAGTTCTLGILQPVVVDGVTFGVCN